MTPRGFGLGALIAAHPFLAAALLAHAALLAAFSVIDTSRTAAVQRAEVMRETAASEERAKTARRRTLVRELEAIDRQMGHGAAPAGSEALDLIESIEKKDLETRAKKLAELLKIAVPEAEAKLKKEADQQKAAHPEGANSPADLQRRAEIALAHEKQRAAAGDGVGLGSGFGSGVATSQIAPAGMRLDGGGLYRYDQPSGYDGDHRTYQTLRATEELQPGSYTLGAGRSFGPGGVMADRVFIDSWYMIGPFQGDGARSQDTAYPPEDEIDLDAAYQGKDGRLLRWQYVQFPTYPIVPQIRAENAVYYGFTEIDMDQDHDLSVSLGVDDDAIVWLNGQTIWKSGANDKPWYHRDFRNYGMRVAQMNMSEVTVQVHFHKGRNTLLFKLYNGQWNLFFSLVVAK